MAVDGAGNVYVADTANHTIRQITPGGVVSTLAGLAGVSGSANGTGAAAQFNQPQGVAVDSAGNVYVADTGNHTIRQITPGGVVSTLAGLAGVSGSANGTGGNARFYEPEAVAGDSGGNVYVADTWNHTIRKIAPGGVVSTLAGTAGNYGSTDGTGSAALFYQPQGVTVDSTGTLYVADTGNQTIRKVTGGGGVSTLAGLAGNYGSVDGTGTSARFYGPSGVAVDGAGNVYVADYFNQTIRKVTGAGVVSTLAGSVGTYGSADGANSAARFWNPDGCGGERDEHGDGVCGGCGQRHDSGADAGRDQLGVQHAGGVGLDGQRGRRRAAGRGSTGRGRQRWTARATCMWLIRKTARFGSDG